MPLVLPHVFHMIRDYRGRRSFECSVRETAAMTERRSSPLIHLFYVVSICATFIDTINGQRAQVPWTQDKVGYNKYYSTRCNDCVHVLVAFIKTKKVITKFLLSIAQHI